MRKAAFVLLCLACSALPASAQDVGKAAYDKHCASCHGQSGEGANGPPLVPYTKELEELTVTIRQGLGMMPSFGRDLISDDEIKAMHEWLKKVSAEQKH